MVKGLPVILIVLVVVVAISAGFYALQNRGSSPSYQQNDNPSIKESIDENAGPSPNDNVESETIPVNTFRNEPELPSEKEKQQLSGCNDILYTNYPVELSKITEIVPLGNLAPPGHTFPTEHTYMHITAGGTTTETITLYSPADVALLLISFTYGITQDPVDYTLWFSLCKDVVGYYNHVKEISPNIQKMVDERDCRFQGESKTSRCNIELFEPIEAGSVVGKVGRLQGNFDFGTIDLRTKLSYANPERYGTRSLHIQCPYDYYDNAMKEKFFELIGRNDADQCGKVMQDVFGTLKGNWFYGESRADMGTDWDKYMAFVQDNKDPSKSVISVGGVFTDAGKMEFTPTNSGFINRDFSQVNSDGNVYCYEGSGIDGRIIIQLASQTQLKIEKQNGTCSGGYIFVSPTVYNR